MYMQREEKKHDFIGCEINLQRLQLKYKVHAFVLLDFLLLYP